MVKENKPLSELDIHGDVFSTHMNGQPVTIEELNFVCDECGHNQIITTQHVVDNWPLDKEITPRCTRCGEKWSERFIFRGTP